LQQRPVVAPCPSRWSPKGMYTAPTATTTTEPTALSHAP
jgi:hypothetical protein